MFQRTYIEVDRPIKSQSKHPLQNNIKISPKDNPYNHKKTKITQYVPNTINQPHHNMLSIYALTYMRTPNTNKLSSGQKSQENYNQPSFVKSLRGQTSRRSTKQGFRVKFQLNESPVDNSSQYFIPQNLLQIKFILGQPLLPVQNSQERNKRPLPGALNFSPLLHFLLFQQNKHRTTPRGQQPQRFPPKKQLPPTPPHPMRKLPQTFPIGPTSGPLRS